MAGAGTDQLRDVVQVEVLVNDTAWNCEVGAGVEVNQVVRENRYCGRNAKYESRIN